ncbi:MAG: signal recognition particle-docking protein FtsY [Ferroplasma sp.]|uniref:signal recognition particle-docking protein FtsY n=1 Tax=Ferroplasma sp. TaxID=2591003 RepID=UPI002816280A|nr:signal recognition particle-docking protein FtsY [Ferroplasma sp.]WMT52191.1 MAG: signal recognition particle-docking protein FtsY [Ferroplasma sp.]
MFDKLKRKFSEVFSGHGEKEVNQDRQSTGSKTVEQDRVIRRVDLEDTIQETLLESDVSFDATEEIIGQLKANLGKIKRKVDYSTVQNELKNVIRDLVNRNNNQAVDLLNIDKKPYVILFLGINGTGKTTTIGKLAYYLKEHNKSVVLSASDTFRAGAIDQLGILARNVGVEIIKHEFKSDPASVAFDAIDHARARKMDFVLIDSAGRMQTNKNLLDEMKKIKRVAKPDMTLLVLDAMIGQDVIEQATTFSREISYDGIIVTKLDTDAKGGSIISISAGIKKPILFVGIGQNMGDLIPFDVEWYLNKIFSS